MTGDRLYRHPTDRVIAGVAGGLGAWLNLDPSLVRIAWVLLALFSGGLFVLVYVVMMIVVPLPPPGWMPGPRTGSGPPPGTPPGWQPGGWDTGWGSGTRGATSGWTPGAGAPGGWSPAPGAEGGTDPGGQSPAATPGGTPWGAPPSGGWTTPGTSSGPNPGTAGLVVGVVLVALGVWFLVDQYVRIDWAVLWPVVIMIAGGGLIAAALVRGRRD